MKELVNDGFAKVVKPYIDAQDKKSREIIAPVEVSPAEATHIIGDQIIFNGLLHNVIAPIAVDDPLTATGAGANIELADDISAQIKAQKAEIQTVRAQAAANNKSTQEMIAPVEEDETDASRDYEIGEQLILGGILYDVIDDIAQHGIITAEGAGANIAVADTIAEQIKNKTITTDAVPTHGSTNPVQSGGTFDAILDEAKTRGELGAKNLLPNEAVTQTKNGVTFTVNSDGSVTANGTATAYTQFDLNSGIEYKEGRYALNGCPSGGGSNTYVIWVRNSAITVGVTDGGNGATLNVTNADTFTASIVVYSGATVNNLTFKPMLRLATDASSDYEPYSMTNQELTPIAQAVSNRNLLDNPWFTVNQRGQSSYSGASNDRVCVDRWIFTSPLNVTVNSDYSISVENTSNDTTWFGELIEMSERGLKGGETVTQSIKLSNGLIYKATAQIPVNTDFVDTIIRENGIESIRIQRLNSNTYFAVFFIMGNSTVNLVATKLELGTVSTLASDTTPNYATELLKCQRYCIALNPEKMNYMFVGLGFAYSATEIDCIIPVPVKMRGGITIVDATQWKLTDGTNWITPSQIALYRAGSVIKAVMTSTGLTIGTPYFMFTDSSDLMLLSADL